MVKTSLNISQSHIFWTTDIFSIRLGVAAVLLLITKSRANKVDMCMWCDQSSKDPTVGSLPRRILVLHLLLSWHHFIHN